LVVNSKLTKFMKLRFAVLLGLGAVAGCTTTGQTLQPEAVPTQQPAAVQPPADDGKLAARIVSAMNGGLVGGSVGSELSNRERRLGLEAEYRALEYTQGGQAVTWKSDRGSSYGEVVASQPYRVGSQDCRQYTHTVYAGGPSTSARGTACRNADGSWTPLT
jgi:surface antigen